MDNPVTPEVQPLSDDALIQAVHDAYSSKAKSGAASDTLYAKTVAQSFGYTAEQLQSIPAESHMGLSCGNPVATAGIKEGENVLDLGSGGGIDILLAAAKAGPRGQAIGLDMLSDMVSLARRNAYKQGLMPPQVAFVQASLTDPLPINSNSIDCILSNCVINLLPLAGKANLLTETHRVLKPGGRIVLDDIVAKKPLPEDVRNNLAAYVGCISGAIEVEVYKNILSNAGFQDAVFVDTHGDINIYFMAESKSTAPGCCTSTTTTVSQCMPALATPANPFKDFDANTWVASYQIYAIKSSNAPVSTDNPKGITSDPLCRWWDAYPAPKSSPEVMTADELSALIRDPSRRSEFAVIDVRRDDYVGGRVRGCFQHPAQAFYDGLVPFSGKFGSTGKVVFYCSSSNGRGPRCAGWYQDYLNEGGQSTSKAYVLQGGVKLWLSKFSNDKDLVDFD